MSGPLVYDGERLDDLFLKGLKIIQRPGLYCFAQDALFLAHFATLKKGARVVDLGTGTGVIPLILWARGGAKEIIGLELQEVLADMARRSIILNGLEKNITIVTGDLREASSLLGHGQFDLVTANPPYLPSHWGEENKVEVVALARHEISCTLEDVFLAASRLLKFKGRLALVHLPTRLAEIMLLAKKYQLEPKRLQLVYPNSGKEAVHVLLEMQKGAGPGLKVLPPVLVRDENGRLSPQVAALYLFAGRGEGGG